ncbi:MAG: YbaN family protein [Acidimicrobiales bacterium]|jgi:hypothetical protein|nr:YbaN family protein [Acidimicrobiales bacterium]
MTGEAGATGDKPLLVRAGWMGLGFAAVGVGGVGVVVPGLPSTVFFIVAAWAFARSSPRLEAWVLALPTIGPTVRDYRDGLGMPKRAKATAGVMIVVFVSLSAWLVDGWALRSAIVSAGVVGLAVVLFRVPTKPPADRPR